MSDNEETQRENGYQKPKLSVSHQGDQSQSPWKEEQFLPVPLEEPLSPMESSGPVSISEGMASLLPPASFKKLPDGWDQPTENAYDERMENQDKTESCLPAFKLPSVKSLPAENNISHEQRCAAITSNICEMLFGDKLPYRGCMSSVAAFILEREVPQSQSSCKETYEVVALGTGDVCYEGWVEFSGQRIHDMHGLVVARRALVRYLYKQLLLYFSQDSTALEKSIFCLAEDGVYLTLKPKFFLHLYLNQMPRGASENFHTTLLQPNASVGLHVHVKGALRLISYCRPSTLSAYTYCVSGSDKLTRWSVLGVQGALLSLIIHPVYITSVVLGDLCEDSVAPHQIINERLHLGPSDGLPKPYSQNEVHLFAGPRIAPLDVPPEYHSLSLNWCGGDKMLELVNGTVGKAVRDILNPTDQYRPSRLCKAAMLKSFKKVAQKMKREDLMLLPTYYEAKVQAEAYQRAKRQVYAQLSLQDLGKWPQKHLVDIFTSETNVSGKLLSTN